MTALVLVLCGCTALVAVLLARRRFVTVTVTGDSMAPALRSGDRVLVRRGRRVCRGDLVVFRRPRDAGHGWMIKRVIAVPGDPVPRREVPAFWTYAAADVIVPGGRLVVLGDNPADSYDSRHFGYVRTDAVLGVAVTRLAAGVRPPALRWEDRL